eukprot:1372085-Ditylum_brightwellii.AAC.1
MLPVDKKGSAISTANISTPQLQDQPIKRMWRPFLVTSQNATKPSMHLKRRRSKMTLINSKFSLMVVTQLMKLMAPKLLSSRTSMILSVPETRRNPVIQTATLRAPTSTSIGNPIEAIVQ